MRLPLGLLLACALPLGARTLTWQELLHQYTDLDRLTRLQTGEHSRQFSSWHRAEETHWGYNADAGQYLREEPNGEAVMFEATGPGCVFRIWSANPRGRLRFYFDGATSPQIDVDFADLFTGRLVPFCKPLAYQRSDANSASDLYFPIPFAKGLKICADRAHGQFYHFNWRQYPADWQVPTFRRQLTVDEQRELGHLAQRWGQCGPDPKPQVAGQRSLRQTVRLAPGATARLLVDRQPGQIRGLRVRVASTEREAWRKLVLRAVWDGSPWPQVWTPLGPFFALDGAPADCAALPIGCVDGEGYCWFTMPYRRSAELTLSSFLSQPATVTYEVQTAPYQPPADDCLFYARWRNEPRSGTFDYPFIETAGRGHLVGTSLQVHHPIPGWWGEGDEKVWVDDEQFPPWVGTGSEDYFGDAWGIRYLPGASYGCSYQQGDRTWNYRWHLVDAIPFTKRLRMTIENYGPNGIWGGVPEYGYSSVAYWYQAETSPPLDELAGQQYVGAARPGVAPGPQPWRRDLFAPLTADALRGLGRAVPGCREAEELFDPRLARLSDAGLPEAFNRELAVDFGTVAGGPIGEATVEVAQGGVWQPALLLPAISTAPLELRLGDQVLRPAGAAQQGLQRFEPVVLPAGPNRLILTATAAGRVVVDALQLHPAPRAEEAMEAEELPARQTTGGGEPLHASGPLVGPSGGRILEWHAGGVGAILSLELPTPKQPYVLGLRAMNGPGAGIVQAFVADRPLGPAFDLYAPQKQPAAHPLPLGMLPAGTRQVELRVVGRNPAATATHVGLDYFVWLPKILHPDSAPGAWAMVMGSRGCQPRIQDLGPQWIGNHHLWMQPAQHQALAEIALHLPTSGKYRLSWRLTTSWDYAEVQALLDGKSVGPPVDTYTPAVLQTPELDLGTFELTAGVHRFGLQAVDKHELSQGYLMGLDYLRVVRVGD
ncbi:MAG: DUF2961 domain-containing protein [Fimbriimonadaceae bacterium]|nr:DUF2961 domain-containing protein [Fimbriimonadaceae bacterium]